MLHRALQQFLADVYWGDLDVLLMDLPPGTGDIAISVAQLLPIAEILVVTTPQLAAAEVAERAGSIAVQTHQQIAGVIENMSWLPCPHCGERIDVFGSGGGQAVADALTRTLGTRVPLLGQIPIDVRLREGGDEGKPLVLTDPDAPAARRAAADRRRLSKRSGSLKGLQLGISPHQRVQLGARRPRRRGAPFDRRRPRLSRMTAGTGSAAMPGAQSHEGQNVRMGNSSSRSSAGSGDGHDERSGLRAWHPPASGGFRVVRRQLAEAQPVGRLPGRTVAGSRCEVVRSSRPRRRPAGACGRSSCGLRSAGSKLENSGPRPALQVVARAVGHPAQVTQRLAGLGGRLWQLARDRRRAAR